MKIPTTEECIELLEEFKVPDNIRKHSFEVNKVSILISKKLIEAGEEINLDLVNAASLLHDIDKIATLKDIHNHGILGCKWLSERNYGEVGEIIRKHTVNKIIKSKNAGWEDIIINYADKRCLGDKVVSLTERVEYITNKYKGLFEEQHKQKIFDMENEIFEKIDIMPEDIK